MKKFTFRIPDALHTTLVAQAQAHRRSLQQYLLLLVETAAQPPRVLQPAHPETRGLE